MTKVRDNRLDLSAELLVERYRPLGKNHEVVECGHLYHSLDPQNSLAHEDVEMLDAL
jgi:hypothetical protein